VSYNGSGTFNINTAGQPVVTGTVISSTAFNALTADLATGLSTAITKDGQTTTTARIVFAQGISSTLTTDATSSTTGSIITAGGISCQKALNVGTTTTLGGALTYGGVTLSNAVTGTGNMVLSASPTLTGTLTAAAATFSGNTTYNGSTNSFDGDTSQLRVRRTSGSANILVLGSVAAWLGSGTNYTDAAIGVVANANFYVNNSGTIAWSAATTGVMTFPNGINYGGVTLSNSVTGTGSMVLSSAPNLSSLGIGMTPTNILDITQTQNAASLGSIYNASNGASANAQWSAKNDSNQATRMIMRGSANAGNFGMSAGAGELSTNSTVALGVGTTTATPLIFGTNNTERGRFGSDGSFLVGTTTNGGWHGDAKTESVRSDGFALSGYGSGTSGSAVASRVDNTGVALLGMFYSSGVVGTITTNGTGVTYGTSSDARLKDNIIDAPEAGAIIDALKVRSWDWKSNGSHEAFGFIAQEEYQIYAPAVVAGDDGDEIERQWSRDDSKLVPLLVKEIQSLRARVAALEA